MLYWCNQVPYAAGRISVRKRLLEAQWTPSQLHGAAKSQPYSNQRLGHYVASCAAVNARWIVQTWKPVKNSRDLML